MSFSPDLKRFRLFRDGSLLDIRNLRVGCNGNAVGGEKDEKKFTHTPSTSKFRQYYLKNVLHTLFSLFLLSSFWRVILPENEPRLGFGLVCFVSSTDILSFSFPDFYCCATIERSKNTWKCGGGRTFFKKKRNEKKKWTHKTGREISTDTYLPGTHDATSRRRRKNHIRLFICSQGQM